MSEQTVEIRFDVRDYADKAKFDAIFKNPTETNLISRWVRYAANFKTSSAEFLESNGLSLRLYFVCGEDFEDGHFDALYRFIASHCDKNPVLRVHYSRTGDSFFMVHHDGKLETFLLEKPLKGLAIAASGGWLESEEQMERDGAIFHEDLNEDVNLFVFGENGDSLLRDKAFDMRIRTVTEEEFEEIYKGWGMYHPNTSKVDFTETQRQRFPAIDSFPKFVSYLNEQKHEPQPEPLPVESAPAILELLRRIKISTVTRYYLFRTSLAIRRIALKSKGKR
jgi:hypothetical protein